MTCLPADLELSRNPGEVDQIANLWILARGTNCNMSAKDPNKFFRDVEDNTLRHAAIERSPLTYHGFESFVDVWQEALKERLSERLGLSAEDLRTLSSPITRAMPWGACSGSARRLEAVTRKQAGLIASLTYCKSRRCEAGREELRDYDQDSATGELGNRFLYCC